MSLSLEEDIRLPDRLILRGAERVQIRIGAEVEEVEPEVLPLDLEGERDDDLADLVVNVVDVENFPEEVDGGRAAWRGRQHVRVVVGQVVQNLPVTKNNDSIVATTAVPFATNLFAQKCYKNVHIPQKYHAF